MAAWLKVIEQIARDRYEGKVQRGQLSNAYIRKTYEELNGGLASGFGTENMRVNKEMGTIAPEVLQMQRNLFKFSGAKNFVMAEDINRILTSEKGKSWGSFWEEVQKLNPKYNKNYLQAEWQTAKQAGYHAAGWQEYQRNKDLYPNLKYKTQGDNKVRDEHRLLEGYIAPIDSDFWKTYYPPNGWRCRCYVVQTAEEPTASPAPTLTDKQLPKEFRGNVGITGQVFKEDNSEGGKPHPYFALSKQSPDFKKAFELSKLAAPYTTVYEAKNGANVQVSPFADEKDLNDNIKTAMVIADKLGVTMKIRADLDHNIVHTKNPEYEINGLKADRKEASSYSSLKSHLETAKKQGANSIVYDITKGFKEWKPSKVTKELVRKINNFIQKDWLQEIYFVNGKKAISFTREELFEDYTKVITKLDELYK
jgi:hypothetical protein|nr:MAG TPA: minor capsid component [Caudoviricetes sp.]